MTTEDALIKISRARKNQEQIGATLHELMRITGLSLRETLADLHEMIDAGVVRCHPTINSAFYSFTNKAYYAK